MHSRNPESPVPTDAASTDTYTHGHHASVLKSHTWRTVENSAGYLIPHLQQGRSLLDVGCGPGTITREFGQRLQPGRVLGIDVSPAIVDQATAATDKMTYPNVEFRVDDCYQLQIEAESFELVHAHQVLQHLSDPVAALKDMKRVVKSDGTVAVRDADYRGMLWYPALPGLDRWMELYQAVARRNKAEPNAGRHLLAWARAAGFTTITPSATTWVFADPGDRSWWGELWAERITDSSLAAQAVSYGLAKPEDLGEIAQAWRTWAADPDGWFAVVNSELLLQS